MNWLALVYFAVVVPWAILIAIAVNLAHVARQCPKCKTPLDFEYHGYHRRYGHCHNCGFCPFCGDGGNKWSY